MKFNNLLNLLSILSILFILMIVIQPVSAENKILTQPPQNHSFSILDSSYMIQYTMQTDSLADPSKGKKNILQIGPSDGLCDISTTGKVGWSFNNVLAHSGTVFAIDLRTMNYPFSDLDTLNSINFFSNSIYAFDIDSSPYLCYTISFTFGYTNGNSLVANKLLLKVYKNEAIPVTNNPSDDGALGSLGSFIPFNFLSLLIAFPLLVLLRRKQL